MRGPSGEPRHDRALILIVGWQGRRFETSEAYARYQPEGLVTHGRHTRLKAGPTIVTSPVEVINEKW